MDLSLRSTKRGYKPVRSAAQVSIAGDASGGVTVGPGVRFVLEGDRSRGAVGGSGGVFFPAVGTDTDAAVTPTAAGVDLSVSLRSPASPQELRYRVVLPSGAQLVQRGSGAVVRIDGEDVLTVAPAMAVDGQGSPVPVEMEVRGENLELRVSHRNRDVAYPILVDPMVSESALSDSSNWSFRNCTDDPKITTTGIGQVTLAAGNYGADECGVWVWKGHGAGIFNVYDDLYWTSSGLFRWGPMGPGLAPSGGVESPKCVQTWATGWSDAFLTRNSNAPMCGSRLYAGFGTYNNGEAPNPNGRALTLDQPQSMTYFRLVVFYEGSHVGASPEPDERAGSGNPSEPNLVQTCAGDPVNCSTGNFFESQTDLRLRGRGLPLALTRTYNVQGAVSGPFGYGWTASFSDHLEVDSAGETITVVNANGSKVPFTTADGAPAPMNPAIHSTLALEGDGTYTLTLPDKSRSRFGTNGLLRSTTDRFGNALTVGRDGSQRVTSITDDAQRAITLTYATDGSDHVATATGPMGTVSYDYDSGGNLTRVTGLDGGEWRFGYDASHRMTTVTDPRNHVTTNVYDGSDRVVSQTDGAGRTRTWDYVSSTRTKITNPSGDVTDEEFNAAGEPLSITHAAGTPSASTRSFYYDDDLNLTQVTEADGTATRSSFDAAGNRTSTTDATGNTTTFTFDGRDVTSVTDALGHTTTYAYAGGALASQRRTLTATGESEVTTFDHNAKGDVTAMTDPLGNEITFGYDSAGNQTSRTEANGDQTTWTYDSSGYTTSVTNAAGKVTTQHNDALGRPTRIKDPLGRETRTSYDPAGNVATNTDALGQVTTYTYDGVGQLTAVKRPDLTTLLSAYDANGRLKSQTDGAGQTTSYVYNDLGDTTAIIDPLGRTTTYTYDNAGHMRSSTDAQNRTTTYWHDAAGRLSSIDYADAKTPRVSYDYDALGRRKKMYDGTGTWSYAYDSLSRLTAVSDNTGQRLGYGYDIAGHQTSITYPNGSKIDREFDTGGRLASITDWLGNKTTFAYDAVSNLKTTTSPAGTGLVDTYGYNDVDELTSLQVKKGSGSLASLNYTRNAAGQVSTAASSGLGAASETYSYSALNQLGSVNAAAAGFDAADNLTKLAGGQALAYDAANQVSTYGFSYDSLGERTQSVVPRQVAFKYVYDKAQRLRTVTPSGVSPSLAGGDSHSLAIGAGGTVHSWGLNSSGQLGKGTTANASIPSQIPGLSNITAIAAGASHSLAVKGDGTAWSWGSNAQGQLGNGTTVTSKTPVQVNALSDATAVAAAPGGSHSLALKADGTVRAWGLNASGQLGNNSTSNASAPVQVSGLTAAKAIGAGAAHSLAVKNGNVWGWGANTCGQLGNNTLTTAKVPVQASALSNVIAVAGGSCHSLALKSDGTVWAWGTNTSGQLGTGTTTASKVPVKIGQLTGVVAIAAGASTSYALKSDGTVWGWGANGSGQLGTGATANATSPVKMAGAAGQGAIAAGGSHALAASSAAGNGSATGLNASGQLGNGATTNSTSIVAVAGLAGIRTFTAATYTYDGDGLRATSTTAGTTQKYTWDQTGSLPEMLSDGANSYLYGPDGLAFAQISTAGTVTYLHHDQLGSTRLLTNPAGATVGTLAYDAYGNLTARTGTADTPLKWAGQAQDPGSGLTYLRARYYDPTTGQFLTRDPLVGITQQPYTYADGDPVNAVDPTGLFAIHLSVPSLEDVSDFAAGFGDAATLGLTSRIRQAGGFDNVDYCSDSYGGGAIAGVGVETIAGGGIVSGLRAAKAEKGLSWVWKTRPRPGADGGISKIGIERVGDDAISQVHRVIVDGKVVHQHQTHIGRYGGERQFPDDWVQFPSVGSP